jgi:hypothetical protein
MRVKLIGVSNALRKCESVPQITLFILPVYLRPIRETDFTLAAEQSRLHNA